MFIFDNVMFAGTVIVRDQMESQNYQPSGGTDGWALLANGDAFLNNATLRGEFVIGPDPGNHIEGRVDGTTAVIYFYTGDASETDPGGFEVSAAGGQLHMTQSSPVTAEGSAVLVLNASDGFATGSVYINTAGVTLPIGSLILDNTDILCDRMQSVSVTQNAIPATVSTVFVVVPGVNLVVPNPFRGNVRVHMDGGLFNSVAANRTEVGFRIRDTNAAGAILYDGTTIVDTISRAGLAATYSTVSGERLVSVGVAGPGPDLYVEMMFRSSAAGTASIQIPNLIVTPEM